MTKEEILDQMNRIKWWHQIDLGQGIITPGLDCTLGRIQHHGCLPDDLRGKTVLDIGAWDGAFSFEAERRGASRVLAVDEFIWAGKGWASKEGFDFARRVLNSKVEDMMIDVYDIGPQNVGIFDVVIFAGVLYHLLHPLLALEHVASVCKNQLILSTHIDLISVKRPAIAFYPGKELAGDPTNWCGPNLPAVEAMLRTVGFKRIEVAAASPLPEQYDVEEVYPGWATVHAWKTS
jgi:tRNA (mo5U34)-methyltransferase